MNSFKVTITLRKQEKERLSRLALRFGLSLPQLTRCVLEELADISAESFEDYDNAKKLRASFSRALRDYRTGKVRTRV